MTIKPIDTYYGGAEWAADMYAEHRDRVFRWLRTKTGSDWSLAEDLTAETFKRAWERRDSFTGGNVGGWLRTIARNAFLDHVRSARVRWEVPVGEFECEEPPDMATPERFVLDREEAESARAAFNAIESHLQGLSGHQAACLRLRHVRGLSVADTAAVMGLSVGAVKTLTRRALLNVHTSMTRGRVRAQLARVGSVEELSTVSGIDCSTLVWIAGGDASSRHLEPRCTLRRTFPSVWASERQTESGAPNPQAGA